MSSKIPAQILDNIYRDALVYIDRAGGAYIYVVETDPDAHIWLEAKKYTAIPEGVHELIAADRKSENIYTTLSEAIQKFNAR